MRHDEIENDPPARPILSARPGSLGNKPIWHWRVSGSAQVVDLLSDIAPFLTSKQDVALSMPAEFVLRKSPAPRRLRERAARVLGALEYGEFRPIDRSGRWQQIGGRLERRK